MPHSLTTRVKTFIARTYMVDEAGGQRRLGTSTPTIEQQVDAWLAAQPEARILATGPLTLTASADGLNEVHTLAVTYTTYAEHTDDRRSEEASSQAAEADTGGTKPPPAEHSEPATAAHVARPEQPAVPSFGGADKRIRRAFPDI